MYSRVTVQKDKLDEECNEESIEERWILIKSIVEYRRRSSSNAVERKPWMDLYIEDLRQESTVVYGHSFLGFAN